MALTLDASTPAFKTKTASGTTLVTASFTAPNNALLVAFVNYDATASASNNHTVTSTPSLTWTLQGRVSTGNNSGVNGGAEIWTATTASSVSRTVTATQTTAKSASIYVGVFTDTAGAPTPGAKSFGHSTSGVPSLAVTTTGPNSWVWANITDWAQAGLGTAGSGQAIVGEYNPSGLITTHVIKQTATTSASGTSVTMNLTAPSGEQYNMITFEILANSGAVTPTGQFFQFF